ncbi:MAG: LacI family transcriptional regulator [Desulfovibrio sp.]|jgi:DNA-binding LacI/PurR family transcriptional regulator|nr:LacI family transcriptional regulator [Desulfovibrio sp.]
MSCSTIKDIAILAGVSQSTVSRAFNMPGMLRQETVLKVHEAARRCNYVYNANAASLSNRRTDTLGVIIPSSAYSAFAINLMGIQKVCFEHNYSCRLAASQFQPEKELQAMRKYHELRVSGLIMAGIDTSNIPYLRTMTADGIPSIVLWESPGEDFNYIAVNNFKAAYEGVDYLISLGHKRIAFLSGPYACARRNLDRFTGYKAALADRGLPFRKDLVRSQFPTFLDGKTSMRVCLALPEPPTAVLCANDYLAIGAIRAIHEMNLSVPDDVSVCGFDNVDISAYFNPPITTMKTLGEKMGRMAAKAIITAIANDEQLHAQYILDAELIVRKSCAACK